MQEQEPDQQDGGGNEELTEEERPEMEPRSTPRIYVASLSDYNAGRLHGAWIDAAVEPDVLTESINDMLRTSPEPGAEEWAIHDYEGFGPLRLGEYESLTTVSTIAQGIAENGPASLTGRASSAPAIPTSSMDSKMPTSANGTVWSPIQRSYSTTSATGRTSIGWCPKAYDPTSRSMWRASPRSRAFRQCHHQSWERRCVHLRHDPMNQKRVVEWSTKGCIPIKGLVKWGFSGVRILVSQDDAHRLGPFCVPVVKTLGSLLASSQSRRRARFHHSPAGVRRLCCSGSRQPGRASPNTPVGLGGRLCYGGLHRSSLSTIFPPIPPTALPSSYTRRHPDIERSVILLEQSKKGPDDHPDEKAEPNMMGGNGAPMEPVEYRGGVADAKAAPTGLKRAVIYIRVSTKMQAQRDGNAEGYSLPTQRTACRDSG